MRFLSKYSFFVLFTAIGLHASAQIMVEDTSKAEPFFKAKKFDSKCYVGLEGTVSQIVKNKAGLITAASLNWVINHKYVINARYGILTSPIYIPKNISHNSSDTIKLNFQFATAGFSYIFFHDKLFSLQPEMTYGWGRVGYILKGKRFKKDFGVIIPAVYATYNATKYFRVGAGINYRFAIGSKLNGITDTYMHGMGGVVFIRVGTF